MLLPPPQLLKIPVGAQQHEKKIPVCGFVNNRKFLLFNTLKKWHITCLIIANKTKTNGNT